MPFNPGQLNWAALSGLASGNNVGEQFANVNNIMAAQQPGLEQKATENKTQAYLDQFHPDIAAQVRAGMPMQNALQMVAQAQQPKTAEFKELADGSYGAWNGSQFTKLGTAQKPANVPAIADEFNWAAQNGFKGTPQEYQVWKANLGKQKGMTVEYDPETGFRMTQGDVDPKAMKPPTEGQSKDLNFLGRAKKAEEALAPIENELTSWSQKRLTGLPYDIGNLTASPEYRKAEQAGREILAIILRKDTGAAVTPQEFETYSKIYLPQPGDDSATIAAKRKSRETAIKGLEDGLGPLVKKDEAASPDGGVVPYTDFFK